MMGQSKFTLWLQASVSESDDKNYRHHLVTEYPNKRDDIIDDLISYVQSAHEDAKRRLRKLADISLDPFDLPAPFDPAEGYPELFHIQTLKGYFGEIFAGLIAEYFSPFDVSNWKVPAFLFRYHGVEFQQLEILRQTSGKAKLRPGRTGDDCLAFQLDDKGQIIRYLYCEAKCTPKHSPNMISNAHKKVSESFLVDLPQVIEILKQKNDEESRQWVRAIQQLWFQGANHKSERFDMVSYICGTNPSQEGHTSWLPTDKPHEKYKSERKLVAVEIHLSNVESLIRRVYGKKDDSELLAPAEYAV